MKTNSTPNVSDLARWIDLQLSTIIEGVSAGYTLGNYNSVWIDKGATVFNVSIANGETAEIDSDNYNNAEEIANAIIATLNNTPSTMNANETTEFSELTHAGQCLDIYLHNTAEIYDRYTAPVISALVNNDHNNGGRTNWDNVINNLCRLDACEPLCTLEGKIYRAIDRARRLVRQYDGMTPTTKDIEQVTRNYAAYIVDCAKYEIEK